VNDLSSSDELGHNWERLPAEIEVEGGDNDMARKPELRNSIDEVAAEELCLVDSDDLIVTRKVEELDALAHARGSSASP
jgi:hypothetical protein